MTGRGPVGVLGVGQIGGGMVRSLRRAGWDVLISPRGKARRADLEAAGALTLPHPSEMAARVDIVISSLPDTAAVRDVLWGDAGLLADGPWHGLLVETSTIPPADAQALAAELAGAGVRMIDAPVSGGAKGAEEGTLSIMVGGDEAVLDEARPVLEAISSRIVHCGDIGAGQVTKACNQLIVMSTLVAVAESLTVAEHAGVDPAKVRDALLGGFASSPILEGQGQRMLDADYAPGGRAVFHAKDIATIAGISRATDLGLPQFEAVRGQIEALLARPGGGELDHAAVYELYPHPSRDTGSESGS